MSSFSYRSICQLLINSKSVVKAHVSCPNLSLKAKELLGMEHTKEGRYTPEDHLKYLKQDNALVDSSNPIIICGIRNVMANHRCIIYKSGNLIPDRTPPYAVDNERPHHSKRPYYTLFEDFTGKLVMDEYLPAGNLEHFNWLFSGVPVLWDNLSREEIYKRILAESSDHSHVYFLPRGNHPGKTDDTIEAWKELHDTFSKHLYSPLDQAFSSIQTIEERRRLKREHNYFHCIIGIDSNSNISFLVKHGLLEDLGEVMRDEFSAKRAICIGNSGSVTLQFCPKGVSGPVIPLIAAPNYRHPGTAFLFIELKDGSFDVL